MRIAHLSAENSRTHGPERRAWYQRHNPTHLRAVAALSEAAWRARDPRTPARAIILGAGACTELPLERLAQAHDAVLLVDVDVPGMTRARDALPGSLRGRVDFLQEDLTGGVSASLATELRTQPWDDLARLGPTAALETAAACLERCPVPDLPALRSDSYGSVVSSLVLTQLFSLPLLDVLDTLNLHAPTAADLRDTSPRYSAAARDFRRRVTRAHLRLLAALLAPGGAALLISDHTGELLPPRTGPHARDPRASFPVLPVEALAIPRDLEAAFTLASPIREWEWLVTLPTADLLGRRYQVFGVVLRPRP
ncbi:MAG: hypothetical protein IVW57_09795 [Ktedonobacterales bacterium]|nr:hypothetical protein [Ktedonobacterales bacterium]